MKKAKACFFVACVTLGSLFAQDQWGSVKNETILQLSGIPGGCSGEKARLIMDLVKEHNFQICVEVGACAARSLFPLVKALHYNKSGKVYVTDALNLVNAINGFSLPDHKQILEAYCTVLKKSPQEAAGQFDDASIDFIHFDGNQNEACAYQDVISYFPKIKDGGWILLDNPNWLSMKRALVYLLERADIKSSFEPRADYLLLCKNARRTKNAYALMDN
ncbi:MAG: class I SAM-dependent methyltransferase [Candidatus Babeliales bacterium]|jgi:hypothetical protein